MALIEEDIEYFLSEDWLGNPGSIEDYIYTGSEQDCYEYLYNADTDYYIYAYGLNTDGTVTSNGITKVPFHSAARPELTVEWDNNTVIPMEGGSLHRTAKYRCHSRLSGDPRWIRNTGLL